MRDLIICFLCCCVGTPGTESHIAEEPVLKIDKDAYSKWSTVGDGKTSRNIVVTNVQ